MNTFKNYTKIKVKAGLLVNELMKIPNIKFVNVSSHTKKIEIDVDFFSGEVNSYLKQVSENTNLPFELLSFITENLSRKKENGLFRISIPFLRECAGAYCGELFLKKQDLYEGVLLINRYEGRYTIALFPEHRFIMDIFFEKIVSSLKKIELDTEAHELACPHITPREGNLGHFCSTCVDVRYNQEQKRLAKEYKQTLYEKNSIKEKECV